MDNREAIKWLKAWSATHQNENDNIREAVWSAIHAIEELEQYRELGTVEEIKKMQCDYAAAEAILVDEFGMDNAETLQQVREAVERMKEV